MNYPCLVALAEDSLEQSCSDGNTPDTSNTTITAKGLSPKESKTESLTKPPYLAISEHSSVKGTPGAIREWLMSLPQDSLVHHFQSQGNILESETIETCGQKQRKPFAKFDQNTFSWRTFQGSLLSPILEPFSETWPRWGICLNGECYQLAPLAHHIHGKDCSLYPTPRETQSRVPNYREHRGLSFSKANIEEVLAKRYPDLIGKRVNQDFLRWLMMWPAGWAQLAPMEMDKFRSWLKQFGD